MPNDPHLADPIYDGRPAVDAQSQFGSDPLLDALRREHGDPRYDIPEALLIQPVRRRGAARHT